MHKVFLLLTLLFAACVSKADTLPNIIFILADDLGWADLPMYGNRFNEAPYLEEMARQGALFTNAYAAAPVCSPTRASIMSGQYPARVGVMDFIPGLWRPYEAVTTPQNRTQHLPRELTTIGEALQHAGYKTGYFGKWHLGDSSIHHPSQRGFDEAHVGQGHYRVKFAPDYQPANGMRLSEALSHYGESFIERNKQHPFFLFLSAFDVHLPLDADSALIAKYLAKPKVEGYPCNAVYAAMVEHLDRTVGSILKKVTDEGLDDRTIVVFFSDNGGLDRNYKLQPLLAADKRSIYEGDSLLYLATSNNPLKGVKGNLYEGGIRVPMLVKWPAHWQGGSVIDRVVTSVDFFPTFVKLAKSTLPDSQIFDGVDIFQEHTEGKRPIFWHYPFFHHGTPASAVRLGNWKLIRDLTDNTQELFDLSSDPGEQMNFISSRPDQANKLSALLDEWLTTVEAPLPVPNPDFDERKRFEWGTHPSKLALSGTL